MVIFYCDGSVDGIFTAVYDAWASRLGHENVALRIGGQMNYELFAEYRKTGTDTGKAQKVARSVRRKMGLDAYQTIYQAALSKEPERADCIYRVLVRPAKPGMRPTAISSLSVSGNWKMASCFRRYRRKIRFCHLWEIILRTGSRMRIL